MFLKTATALLVLAGSGAISTAAFAEETGMAGCVHMRKEVSQALDTNQQSPNLGQARDLQRAAQDFCYAGFYDKGLARYAKALELLNTNKALDVTGPKKS